MAPERVKPDPVTATPRSSASADGAHRLELEEIRAMSSRERIELALKLGDLAAQLGRATLRPSD